jgi:hypothetical protein
MSALSIALDIINPMKKGAFKDKQNNICLFGLAFAKVGNLFFFKTQNMEIIFIIPDILDPVLQPDPTFSISYTLLILSINNV